MIMRKRNCGNKREGVGLEYNRLQPGATGGSRGGSGVVDPGWRHTGGG